MKRLLAILLLTLPAPAAQYTTESPWIWPLSGDYYTPRELLHTHGQPQFLASSVLLHQGIDILAGWDEVVWGVGDFGGGTVLLTTTELEVVRASFDGYVRFVNFTEGATNNYVVISPEKTSDWGLRYTHLESVWVSEGESVFRSESLGRVALDADDPDRTHLDLALVQCKASGECDYPDELGNPLPWMSSRPDHTAPVFDLIGPLGTSSSDPSAPLVFLDEFHEPLLPSSGLYPTVEGEVRMLVRVSDAFETASAPTAMRNVPLRIRATVRRVFLVLVGFPTPVPPDIYVPLTYDNTIEFLDPIDDVISASCFRSGTGTFDSSDGDFYVIVTHGIDTEGTWDTKETANGVYAVEVSAEDAAGNLSSVTAFVMVSN